MLRVMLSAVIAGSARSRWIGITFSQCIAHMFDIARTGPRPLLVDDKSERQHH
jgi:hypothetical protein